MVWVDIQGGTVENARQGGLANLAKFGVMHAKEKRESRERKRVIRTGWRMSVVVVKGVDF